MLHSKSINRRTSWLRRAALLLLPLLMLTVASCTETGLFSPNREEGARRLLLRPYFASLDGMSSMAVDINVIRLTIKKLPAGTVESVQEFPVDPAATSWNLPVEVPANSDLEILIELVNKVGETETTVYSGTLTLQTTTGPQPTPQEVPVYPGPPENLSVKSVTIAPRGGEVLEGDQVKLSAQVAGPASATVTWLSLNSTVATVDGAGLVTTKLPGQAVIRAQSGPATDNVTVTVGAKAAQIEITPASATLVSLGAEATFTGRVLDARAGVLDLPISWGVADATIAAQTGPNVFQAKQNGTTTVTASALQAGRTVTANATLKVEQRAVSVVLNPSAVTLRSLGETAPFTAQAKDANGNAVSGLTFTWTSSDAGVVTVDGSGVATAAGNGTAKVKVDAAGASAEALVTVNQTAASLMLTPEEWTFQTLGETKAFSAEVKDARGNVMSVPITWATALPTIATVDGSGVATANGDGVTVLTAAAGSQRAAATLHVERVVTQILLNQTSLELNAGESYQAVAVVADKGGAEVPGQSLTWVSAQPSIASVTSSGLIHAMSAGDAEIVVTSGRLSNRIAVSVTGSSSIGVDIVPASPSPYAANCIPFGDNASYHFTGFIYRNIPAFSVNPGDKIAFDLGAPNDVAVQRNIFLAAANINPAAPVISGNNITTSQGVQALAWTKVVSESATPGGSVKGNTIIGDFDLVYTAEASFTFPGGGLIVGVSGTPEATYVDYGCNQVLAYTSSADPSEKFYARFWSQSDQSLAVLDVVTGGGNADFIGGMRIYRAPAASSAARITIFGARPAALQPDRTDTEAAGLGAPVVEKPRSEKRQTRSER